jgi:hypothetical protein
MFLSTSGGNASRSFKVGTDSSQADEPSACDWTLDPQGSAQGPLRWTRTTSLGLIPISYCGSFS